jgi:hypothetical protein
MIRRTLTTLPLALVAGLWALTASRTAWVAVGGGYGAVVDRGAAYLGTGFDDAAGAALFARRPVALEGEYGTTVDRWAPVRRLLPGLYVVPLWAPALPAAGLAWWGWRRGRRPKLGRGFEVGRGTKPPPPG